VKDVFIIALLCPATHSIMCMLQGAAKTVMTNGESRLFWLSLVVSQVFWVVFIFAAVLTLSVKWIVR